MDSTLDIPTTSMILGARSVPRPGCEKPRELLPGLLAARSGTVLELTA